MRERIVKNIIESGSKLAVLIDESTTLSSATSMIVYIKTSISNEEPIFIFLEFPINGDGVSMCESNELGLFLSP